METFEFVPLADEAGAEPAKAGADSSARLSLAAVDSAEVPGGRLQVWLGPKIIGGRYFRLLLDGGDGAPRRFVQGLYNDGPYPGHNWAEIFDIELPQELADLPEWPDRLTPYLRPLGGVVPPGGHVMIEYEKTMWRTTQLGLLAGIPPPATPLGGLLRRIGTGDSFKDWYFPEGGQEGGRKLQGNRAYTKHQASEMGEKRAAELREYLASPIRGDAEIEARARQQAEQVLEELAS